MTLKRRQTSLHEIVAALIDRLPPQERVYRGEHSYVMLATKLIYSRLESEFEACGEAPPTLATVRGWFYFGVPAWVLALLKSTTGEEENGEER